MTNKIKNCVICNNDFTIKENTREENKSTCGKQSCRSRLAARKKQEIRTCILCNDTFKIQKQFSRNKCEKCRKKEKINCIICGTEKIVKIGTKTCSKRCAANYAKTKNIISLICSNCHKEFNRSSMFVNDKQHTQFCSNECKKDYGKKYYPKRLPSRYGKTWWLIRKNILMRDNYKCLLCKSSHNLEVHHFVKMSKFNNPDESHFTNNLGTFCKACHYKVEKINYLSYNDFINKQKI